LATQLIQIIDLHNRQAGSLTYWELLTATAHCPYFSTFTPMSRYVAFLRGINVSGQKLIKMEELRKHFEMPGFKNITSYIQSGNVLFDTKETDEAKLRSKIEKQLAAKLGYQVSTIVRSTTNIETIIKNNPFTFIEKSDIRKVYIALLSDSPPASLHKTLDAYKKDGEEFMILEREIYLLLGSAADTKLSNALIEKKLGVVSTTRNLATMNKVLEL